MLGKLILLLLAVGLVVLLLKHYRRSQTPPPAPRASQDMVRCAHCGVHLPRSESLLADGRYYCCESHRDQHA